MSTNRDLLPLDAVVASAREVAASFGRATIGEDDIGLALIGLTTHLVRGLGVDPEEWRRLTLRYLARPHPAAASGEFLDRTAQALLAGAGAEAARAGDDIIHAGHLLAALLTVDGSTVAANGRSIGLTAAKVRRRAGLPPHRRVLAGGARPDGASVPAGARFVLLGGGHMADALPAALATAAEFAGVALSDLRVAVIGATNRYGGAAMAARLRRLGVSAVDTQIDDRDQAEKAAALPAGIHAIYVTGGDPAQGADALLGSPALAAISERVRAGAVLMGHSAGATIWGASTLSDYLSQDEPEPVPMLGWIPNTVVVAHHQSSGPRLPAAQAAYAGSRILAIAHEGAVAIDGSGAVTEVASGETPSMVVPPASG